jgi:hypothetical protein
MNIEDRADLGLDVDGASTEEPWRDVHRGFFAVRQFQVSMNDILFTTKLGLIAHVVTPSTTLDIHRCSQCARNSHRNAHSVYLLEDCSSRTLRH